MMTLVRLVVLLYPSWWRRRYGREFEALLVDVSPGWLDLVDVTVGALTMRFRSLITIPAACAIAGALVGTAIAVRTPTIYASSATLSFSAAPAPSPSPVGAARVLDVRVPVEAALAATTGKRGATSVTLLHGNTDGTLVQVTYADADPRRAKAVAERLADAVVRLDASLAPRIVAAPELPTSPEHPRYLTAIGGGTAVGLVGGLAVVLGARRRRPGRAGADL